MLPAEVSGVVEPVEPVPDDVVDEVLLFSTELTCEEHKIESDIIMLPETNTLKKILALLEQMVSA